MDQITDAPRKLHKRKITLTPSMKEMRRTQIEEVAHRLGVLKADLRQIKLADALTKEPSHFVRRAFVDVAKAYKRLQTELGK